MKARSVLPRGLSLTIAAAFLLGACQSQAGVLPPAANPPAVAGDQVDAGDSPAAQEAQPAPTSFPERPRYAPGELVDYTAQAGDTLPALAVRFNTSVEEIRLANPIIPQTATTMPPGMPMKIPIYYLPFWGSPYQIIPDSLFVNGPAQVGFDTAAFIAAQPGWLNGYREYASDADRSAAGLIDLVARNYSVSPRLLLALLEYQSAALTQPAASESALAYPMGYVSRSRQGLYLQLIWAANQLNNGYYRWRAPTLTSLEREDGRLVRFDPWQNAATVSLHNFFSVLLDDASFDRAIAPDGFAQTYRNLFGDPWVQSTAHIPGSLEQPAFLLPFEPGHTWAYTGGPHTAWGVGEPLAALDFAPPLTNAGCQPTDVWATAVADGTVVRTGEGEIVLDLDGDGDERTGWNVFYLHLAAEGRVPLGAQLKAGDPVGHPSCEGGSSTGTHVHIARKYNGEWLAAEGMLPFNLEGWIAHYGSQPYLGTLTRDNRVVRACTCSNAASFIRSDRR
jgi:murein DD-endopeptidase MepM/ murein hydrolase activator NlpD